ncbi:MAG: hypothetical protein U9Q12_04130 [Patescibacteria group bacterium]|nr:hypothetical protein [Patescibacteria group bacterium]
MKSQYIIILTIIIALTASMLFLAQVENDQRADNQDFWSVYFVDPLGVDNRFVIDNETPKTKTFHYDIAIDENIIQSEDVKIEKNNRKLVEVRELEFTKPLTITITTDEEIKKIYKK